MKNKKRVFLIVLDSLGVGNAPDAADFFDEGANTLRRISGSDGFSIPTLLSLGIGHIDGVDYLEKREPQAAVARLCELSRGKDTTTGHWELMGIVSKTAMPTYPEGFPREVIEKFENAVGRGTLCNLPYSGTDVIRDFGEEHLKSGKLIVYTSADSVFQIAAHEELVPPEELYRICRVARDILTGEHAVGRVIARPFAGEVGNFVRTDRRRDFSLLPPSDTALDDISGAGREVIAVGKIRDIFAGKGITRHLPTHSNREGMECAEKMLSEDFSGLCFINLVDFDMLYGHRQDVSGYARALSEFDAWLSGFIEKMKEGDLLMITADHGCDPGDDSTDHTRECVPLIIYGGVTCGNFGTLSGFYHAGDVAADALGVRKNAKEDALWKKIN